MFSKSYLGKVLLSTVTTGSFEEPILETEGCRRVDLVVELVEDHHFHLEELKKLAPLDKPRDHFVIGPTYHTNIKYHHHIT